MKPQENKGKALVENLNLTLKANLAKMTIIANKISNKPVSKIDQHGIYGRITMVFATVVGGLCLRSKGDKVTHKFQILQIHMVSQKHRRYRYNT